MARVAKPSCLLVMILLQKIHRSFAATRVNRKTRRARTSITGTSGTPQEAAEKSPGLRRLAASEAKALSNFAGVGRGAKAPLCHGPAGFHDSSAACEMP